jgi:hypothetical protein
MPLRSGRWGPVMIDYYPRTWNGHLEVQFADETDAEFEVRMADKHKSRPPRPPFREVRDRDTT